MRTREDVFKDLEKCDYKVITNEDDLIELKYIHSCHIISISNKTIDKSINLNVYDECFLIRDIKLIIEIMDIMEFGTRNKNLCLYI